MSSTRIYNPFVVWATCFLWLISLIAIVWSLLLFFCLNDILLLTDIALVNAFILLSGLIMLPTNIYMLCSISNGNKIDHKAKVGCCPLWLSIVWIVIINAIAAVVCITKIYSCPELIIEEIKLGMRRYRNDLKFKHFLDTLQWSLKCCGLHSYKDWFSQDWYDKIRDYEWDYSPGRSASKFDTRSTGVSDSVPLRFCCKSGSCISNYLSELGTHSINTSGCAPLMYRIVMMALTAHLIMFLMIILLEVIILKLIMKKDTSNNDRCRENTDVKHIMCIKDHFRTSSVSCQLNPDDSDELESP